MWDAVYPYLAALLPTVGILVLFFVVIRNLLSADRQERKAQAQWQATHASPEGGSTSDRRGSPAAGPSGHVAAGSAAGGPSAPAEEGAIPFPDVAGSATSAQHRSEPDDTGHDQRE